MGAAGHFTRDPGICGGEPVLAGTRVALRVVQTSLAEGVSVEEILADDPTLTEAQVRAAISFAAAAAGDDLPVPETRTSV